jgi:hypothetical protein
MLKVRSARLVVVLAGGLALMPVMGGTAGATSTDNFRSATKGATAFFTTCPERPISIVCGQRFITVSDGKSTFNGVAQIGTFVFYDHVTLSFDAAGRPRVIADRFAEGPGTLSIDRKLTAASLSATLPLRLCRATCSDAGTISLSVSWTGEGDQYVISDRFHELFDGTRISEHFTSTQRDATATGTQNGKDLGTNIYAYLFKSRSGGVVICRDNCTI